jgi:hypothetical protein
VSLRGANRESDLIGGVPSMSNRHLAGPPVVSGMVVRGGLVTQENEVTQVVSLYEDLMALACISGPLRGQIS